MNSMKYFLLSVVCLCFTIGVQAQTAKFIREYRNPKIEGLLNYAESLGREVTYAIFSLVSSINDSWIVFILSFRDNS